jgi:hypothetical protein
MFLYIKKFSIINVYKGILLNKLIFNYKITKIKIFNFVIYIKYSVVFSIFIYWNSFLFNKTIICDSKRYKKLLTKIN